MEDIKENQDIFDSNDINNNEDSNMDLDSSLEDESENLFEYGNFHKYDKDKYLLKDIITKLMNCNIIRNKIACLLCNNSMNLTSNETYIDGLVWRCVKKGINKHGVKTNIRQNSVFENLRTDMRLLCFIIFENFIYNYSINKVYNNCIEFSKDLGIICVSRKTLGKIFNVIRIKIQKKMHFDWSHNKMGMEPCLDGKSKIEIDESKFITYEGRVR